MVPQRLSFDYSHLFVGMENTVVLERAISDLARRFDMRWRLAYTSELKRVAVLVSKIDHCLYDLLIRWRTGATPRFGRLWLHLCSSKAAAELLLPLVTVSGCASW
jgi:hypothetical protein